METVTGAILFLLMAVGLFWMMLKVGQHDEKRADAVSKHLYAMATMADIVNATGQAEPMRPDRNDPLRQRYVFCGRWTDTSHAQNCPWQNAVRVVNAEDTST